MSTESETLSMGKNEESKEEFIHRIEDYVRATYLVPKTELKFSLHPTKTKIIATYTIKPIDAKSIQPLVLNGDITIKLESLTDKNSDNVKYTVCKRGDNERDLIVSPESVLSLLDDNDEFTLTISCEIDPKNNTELKGLYMSNNVYCTQCEPNGFRTIVYSFDRPDILSSYTVNIDADEKECPIILSNGNFISTKSENGRKIVTWTDPHPKPSYLFALVAGDLGFIESEYYIQNKTDDLSKKVDIRIYATKDKLDRLGWAMESIKRAFVWDEKTYGLFYDLSVFNIVCLDDFNSGAMENKGLNIFNAKYLLASPQTATDVDYEMIEGVVGHEYFHNWTGNRVTLEKWFDLTLKEGLTVFRDQNFSMDVRTSRAKAIIDRAITLRTTQFIEDSSGNAHPIRPKSYKVMDNFYTSTVYEKGAEIIRIYETYLGKENFRKGMDLYFQRHDGTAVACEDFWKAMFDAHVLNSNINEDLAQIERCMYSLFNWYKQPGTPIVSIDYKYDSHKSKFIVKLKQENPTCVKINKCYQPVLIPVRMGLIDRIYFNEVREIILPFCESEQEFEIYDIKSDCVPSFMRDFSAPVIINYDMSIEERLFLLLTDSNKFNRWEQSQIIHADIIKRVYNGESIESDNIKFYINEISSVLEDPDTDSIIKPYLITLPENDMMFNIIQKCDPLKYRNVINSIYKQIAIKTKDYLESTTQNIIKQLESQTYDVSHEQVASRELLRSVMLVRLSLNDSSRRTYVDSIKRMFYEMDNLTIKTICIESIARFISIDDVDDEQLYGDLIKMIDSMAEIIKTDNLMISKWLKFFSKIHSPKVIQLLTDLFTGAHERSNLISKTTPNHLYALTRTFTLNPYMHYTVKTKTIDDSSKTEAIGYKYIADRIIDIDKYNTSVASAITSAFNSINFVDSVYNKLMINEIDRILSDPKISVSVSELLILGTV